jgi:hypothetical protein
MKSYMKNKKKSLVDDEDAGLVDELTGDAPEVQTFSTRKKKPEPAGTSTASAKRAVKFDPMIDSESQDSENEGTPRSLTKLC